jgi:hypothetical protein
MLSTIHLSVPRSVKEPHAVRHGSIMLCFLLAVMLPSLAASQEPLEEVAKNHGNWYLGVAGGDSFSDIAVLRKVSDERIGTRIARPVPHSTDGQERLVCFVETYDVVSARKGVIAGRVRLFVPGRDSASDALRPREVGAYCVGFVCAAEAGWYRLGPSVAPSTWDDARLYMEKEATTDALLFASFDLPGPAEWEPGLDAGTAAFSMAIRGLSQLGSAQRLRTLTMLQTCDIEPGKPRQAMTRIGRDLLSVVDSLDPKDRWLAYGLFVKAGLTSYYGLAVDSLVEAAREEEYWSSLPESARQGWGRWLRKANAEPIETKGIMGSMSRAVEAAEAVHDRRLRYALIR